MKIQIPTNCPTCDSVLEQVNSQLFCRNNNCNAQTSKKIEAFASKMKIKGLGPATILKLDIVDIKEIYDLEEEYLVDILGEKIGKKVFSEIDKTLESSFSTFLSALSIPLIGKVAAEKISKYINNINDIDEEILIKAGVGQKARESLLKWCNVNLDSLPTIRFTPKKAREVAVSLGNVCITGKLNHFKNRSEATEYLESLGYSVVNTVNKQTNYLVDEEGISSSKRTKAKQLNINIVTIKQLEEMINE